MAEEITSLLGQYKKEVEDWEKLEKEINELEELSEVLEGKDLEHLKKKISEIENELKKEEIKAFLSGEFDKKGAILQIFAGAGGQDAQDWVAILKRMYEKYCQKKGFSVKVLHQSFGEGIGPEGRIGLKQVTLEIKGPYAFGLLKKEAGVHRLVRISPFSAKNLRHTSFAKVELLPQIKTEKELKIKIKPEDLKIDFYRASGPGGQYVNKRETAVRITHLPTGLQVSCQSERLQGENRKKAMELLYSKLYQFKKEKLEKRIEDFKKEVSPSWGNQIRSYIFHPYKLVKDHRTGVERSDIDEVLDGDLDDFIEKEIKLKNE